MKWFNRLFVTFIAAALIAATGKTNVSAENKTSSQDSNQHLIKIRLIGINDLHGQLNVTRLINGKPAGRVDFLAAYLKRYAAENKHAFIVHAGDMIGVSPPVSALMDDKPTIEILNKIGTAVGTVGNHEFDKGVSRLKNLINGSLESKTKQCSDLKFPWIVANVIDKATGKTILPPYKVINVNGVPIGFIGVVTTETASSVMPSAISEVKFTDEIEAINRNVDLLKQQGLKAIVVLAHNSGTSGPHGENPTGKLAEIARGVDDEVDIIFGGHNHAYMNTVINRKLVVQAYSYGTAFSNVDIGVDPVTQDVVQKRAEIVTTYHEGMRPDPEIRKLLEGYEAKIAPKVNRVIGTTSVNLTAQNDKSGESVLGDFIADAQLRSMESDLAFMNTGGIRADLKAGTISWGDVFKVLPYQNRLVKMTMTGKQIRQALNQQWGRKTNILQISGLTYTWDTNRPSGDKVVSMKLKDGSEIAPNKTYTVTANSFLADGGDGFSTFTKAQNKKTGPIDLDALIDYISSQPKPFTYRIQNRIQRILVSGTM